MITITIAGIVGRQDPYVIALGRQGENLARQVLFDLSFWEELYGTGTAQLIHQRSGDEAPYPCELIQGDGSAVIWNIRSADTAMAGRGRAELRYYVGETLAKSVAWPTRVETALEAPGEPPAAPEGSWVDKVLAAGTAALEAAERAKTAVNTDSLVFFAVDPDSGSLLMTRSDDYSGPEFSINENGELEVSINGES